MRQGRNKTKQRSLSWPSSFCGLSFVCLPTTISSTLAQISISVSTNHFNLFWIDPSKVCATLIQYSVFVFFFINKFVKLFMHMLISTQIGKKIFGFWVLNCWPRWIFRKRVICFCFCCLLWAICFDLNFTFQRFVNLLEHYRDLWKKHLCVAGMCGRIVA